MDGDAPAPEDNDLVRLVRQVVDDALHLARAELDVVRARLTQAMIGLAIAIAMFLVAAILLLIGAIDALGALPEHFGPILLGDSWKGWAVLGGIFIVVAGLIAFLGMVRMRRSINEGKRALDAAKEDAEWLRGLTKRSVSGS